MSTRWTTRAKNSRVAHQRSHHQTARRLVCMRPMRASQEKEHTMSQAVTPPKLDVDTLRGAIRKAYAEVATNPTWGFHFHTGWPLAKMLG
jgi:hypothetical protein